MFVEYVKSFFIHIIWVVVSLEKSQVFAGEGISSTNFTRKVVHMDPKSKMDLGFSKVSTTSFVNASDNDLATKIRQLEFTVGHLSQQVAIMNSEKQQSNYPDSEIEEIPQLLSQVKIEEEIPQFLPQVKIEDKIPKGLSQVNIEEEIPQVLPQVKIEDKIPKDSPVQSPIHEADDESFKEPRAMKIHGIVGVVMDIGGTSMVASSDVVFNAFFQTSTKRPYTQKKQTDQKANAVAKVPRKQFKSDQRIECTDCHEFYKGNSALKIHKKKCSGTPSQQKVAKAAAAAKREIAEAPKSSESSQSVFTALSLGSNPEESSFHDDHSEDVVKIESMLESKSEESVIFID